ncbi:TPA_exp: Uncharacterized protein A8136_6361 [Trichophyton benhamiae CBS 112371]|uniref:BZIP domain-containing protein n=1 Tax=Arthroderma benhamiae (strain ATCC MYA-4681 / CBS 112371) TaxID=663331 RepID=D4B5T8_ARTBC|nr:uncharacterized protein ARB_03845 [Trichophyton benhamiae CBS 112371]EFE29274.1 conserved hypothetical protein [Trichophyton benhamiae CBS 112371]DAA72558.1 TPA_exp: Uncharacterized protein A8136_6361 [Trichophyton benhamiae CBS 112371]
MTAMNKQKRKADNIVVPDLAEDAAERKRVLNVLAQRRYRQRKREQLAELEAKARQTQPRTPESSEKVTPPGSESSTGRASVNLSETIGEQAPTPPELDLELDGNAPPTFGNGPLSFSSSLDGQTKILGESILDLTSIPEFTFDSSSLSAIGSLSAMGTETPPPDLPSPPADLQLSPTARTSPSLSMLSLQFLANYPQDDTQPLSSALQSFQTSNFTFPDDKILEVPPLTLLRAMLTIATRLKLTEYIWNLAGISPFYTGPTALGADVAQHLDLAGIPRNFHPTPTQRLVPHHAILDLLPWPSARDKLIQVFSLPVQFRPPAAADPMGLMGLVYDIEDAGEGLRVSGPDPFSPEMWEVGQLVFQRWWWAFEGSIVERSNRLRNERGKQGLILGAGP